MTAQDFIYASLRRCGQLRPGYQANAELLADGLREIGFMFDGWNTRRTMNYTVPDYVYPVTGQGNAAIESGQINGLGFYIGPSFTIAAGGTTSGINLVAFSGTSNLIAGLRPGMSLSGNAISPGTTITDVFPDFSPGVQLLQISQVATQTGTNDVIVTADFVGPRPTAIIRANLVYQATSGPPTRIPLSPVSAEEWASINVLQLTPINVTTVFYYEPAWPFGIIWCWPPLNANSLEFFTYGFLNPPITVSDPMQYPPGYQDAIIFTLAERLWPMCTLDVLVHKYPLALLRTDAYKARVELRNLNKPMPRMRNDMGTGGMSRNAGVCDWTLLLTGVPY
jgi:hypothetical protein